MLGNLTGWHFLIIALIILLLFGATKLPALAKGVGQSMKIFKNEMKTDENGNEKTSGDAAKSDANSAAVKQPDSTESNSKP
jgi:sec-independent protein translocase protein TatA